MKYSKGDIVYLAYGTEPYEITDIFGTTYFLKATTKSAYIDSFETFQTEDESTINTRTIYERLAEIEKWMAVDWKLESRTSK